MVRWEGRRLWSLVLMAWGDWEGLCKTARARLLGTVPVFMQVESLEVLQPKDLAKFRIKIKTKGEDVPSVNYCERWPLARTGQSRIHLTRGS